MELAEGGDLFDKIESDVGVGEDVAHAYFTQLVSAVEFMHAKGVGHRDIKPENVLLSKEGSLKVADFGLATLFQHGARRKASRTSCGSPPYTAPEVVRCEGPGKKGEVVSGGSGSELVYFADQVDVWSCGVVLFVLLVGNTPWDEPSDKSYEFHEYVKTGGRPDDELFERLPPQAYDLLRGVLNVDPAKRATIADIRRHPWFQRPNPFLKPDGGLANPLAMATSMFESMKIDLSQNPYAPSSQSQSRSASQHQQNLHSPDVSQSYGDEDDAMDVDNSQPTRTNTAIMRGEDSEATPIAEITFDWERPGAQQGLSATPSYSPPSSSLRDTLADEPALSQFTPAPAVPLSRTQFARRFADILSADTLNVFYSNWNVRPLLERLGAALKALGVPMPENPAGALLGGEEVASLSIRAKDGRGQKMRGEVVVQKVGYGEDCGCHITFVKMSGDPVEWRRLFKRVVLLCKEMVYVPDEL